MKKSLLFAAAALCAATASAQVFQLDGESFGFSGDAVDCAAGTQWGTVGTITLSNPFATQHKLVDCKNNDYNQVIFNGADVVLTKNGVQGQDNPKDIDGGNPGVTLVKPATGAAIQIDAAADGYVYVVAKLSSNKNYYVFEEGTPVGFTLAMEIADERFADNKIVYTVEGEGELNEIKNADFTTNWPVRVATQDLEAATAGNGLGVIGFPVYEGCSYLVGAGGSKISWCGAYLTSAPCSVVIKGDEKAEFTLLEGGDAPVVDPEPEPEPEPVVGGPAGKALAVTCAEAKANPWDSQVFINFPAPLAAGVQYTITMDVKGSQALEPKQGQYGLEAIQPIAQDNNSANKDEWGGPADLQYLPHFAVATEWVNNVKDCDGNAIVTDGNFPYSRLCLNLGLYAGTIYIDNVRAIAADGAEAFCITFDTEAEQALVENGWMNLPKEFVDVEGAGINAVAADAISNVTFNLAGQKAAAAKGLMIRNGKVIMVK